MQLCQFDMPAVVAGVTIQVLSISAGVVSNPIKIMRYAPGCYYRPNPNLYIRQIAWTVIEGRTSIGSTTWSKTQKKMDLICAKRTTLMKIVWRVCQCLTYFNMMYEGHVKNSNTMQGVCCRKSNMINKGGQSIKIWCMEGSQNLQDCHRGVFITGTALINIGQEMDKLTWNMNIVLGLQWLSGSIFLCLIADT